MKGEPAELEDAVYRLRFFFDAGSGTCLWSANEAALGRFGYAVDQADLPLSDELQIALHALTEDYDTSLDWNDPGGPSPWSPDDLASFAAFATGVLARLRAELGPTFVIMDERQPQEREDS